MLRYLYIRECHGVLLKVTNTVFLDVTEGGQPLGRIEIGLFGAPDLQANPPVRFRGLLAHGHAGVSAVRTTVI